MVSKDLNIYEKAQSFLAVRLCYFCWLMLVCIRSHGSSYFLSKRNIFVTQNFSFNFTLADSFNSALNISAPSLPTDLSEHRAGISSHFTFHLQRCFHLRAATSQGSKSLGAAGLWNAPDQQKRGFSFLAGCRSGCAPRGRAVSAPASRPIQRNARRAFGSARTVTPECQ